MFESKINKGRANGYAPLDSGSKVPLSYLPPIQSTIDTGSFATTSSLQTFSESIDVRVTDLENWSSSLTDTFATDLEVSIVSSSVAATIGIVSSAVGLVTTSSFNAYTASQSTASLATTGSNEFNGNQTINGIIQGTGSLYLKADSSDNRHFEIYNTSPNDTHIKSNGGISFFGDDTNYVKIDDSTGDVTIAAFSDIILDADDGGVYIGSYSSDNGVITNGYLNTIIGDTNIINGSTGNSITDVIGRIPIVNSGSFATTSSLQTLIDTTGSFATTGSNTFNGNQIISGSLTIASGSAIYGIQQLSGAILLQPVEDPDPLSQATTGTHLFVSSSNNQTGEDLYFRQADNKVKWKWVEGKLNTGILSGGSISYSGSLVYVKAGTGIILSHNASLSEEISVVTNYVHWNDYTASCQNITSSLATYLYVDSNGTIQQSDTYFTPTQYRTAIPIGMVNHTGKNVITSVANNVSTAYDDVSQTSDFIRAFGPMKLKGLSMTAATNSLKFNIEAGTSYILGGFYQQDPNNSSYKETSLIQTGSLQIARVRRDGNGGFIVDNNNGNFYNSIDSDYWDDGTGTLNTMAAGDWQIQRVFFNPFTNRCHIYYGQYGTYSSFINAKQYLASDPFVEAEYSAHQYVFLGYLILKGQTNNLADDNNNLVVQSGLFRNTVGSSGGTQTFTHLHDLADVEVADPSNKDLLSYNSSTGLWEHHTFGYLGLATTSSLNGVISGSSQLTSSFDTRYAQSGSYLTSLNGAVSSSTQVLGGSGVYSSSAQLPSGLVSGSSQLSSSYDSRYVLSGSITQTTWDNIASKPSGIVSGSSQILGGSGIYSSSAQLPSGLISGSSQLPSGIVSGSSQLTASYDTRYTLSGSVVSGTTPAGTISGSSQLTSSFDGRYVQTGSFNTLTASFNSFTASAQSVTTGSNSFNGTQTITGSLNVTSGNIIASSITANTSSLYLTSGSNLYVQNNGLVEITGSLVITGSVNIISTNALQIGTGSGDEGGEILLAKSQTNNSLTGSGITIDSFQNKIRIFEQGGNARGVYVDLSKAPNGVAGELLWKASGLVNAGVDVTLGNLKARLASSGNYSLQVSTVSGTYSVYGSSVYSYNGIGGVTLSSPLSITTTPAYLSAGYNFLVAGSTDTWNIVDTSAGIAWRITLIIGPSFTNNMISIERLV